MTWEGTVARYCLTGLLGVVCVALSVAGFQVFKDQDFHRARKAIEERSQDYIVAVNESLTAHLEPLYSIASLFNAVADVDRERFRSFNRDILARLSDIQALEWIPRVPSAERRDYERRARAEGHPGFRISERGTGGGMVPVADRAEYFPVYYVEPLSGNERALGFDLASNPVRRAALEKARDTGNMVISGRIRLVQESGESFGFLAFLPVYAGDAPPESVDGRRRHLAGFALGVFRVIDMVETTQAKRTRPSGLDLYLFDNDAPADSRLLYFHPSRARDAAIPPESEDQVLAGFHISRTLPVADRQWTVVFKPVPGYFTGETTWTPWMVLFGGLALTGMFVAFLVSAIDRERKVSLLVAERTSALRETEKELRESEARTRAVVDNVVDGIITIDERGVIQSVNPATNRIFGFGAGELEGRNVSILAAEPINSAHDGYLANYVKTGDTKIIGIGREVVGRRRNAETFPMELTVSELKLAGKRLFVGVARDITERKEVDRMKSEFISTVSHELRTPLTSIQGSLGLLLGGVGGEMPEKATALIEVAHRNSDRLVRLINDILDIQKMEAGKIDFDVRPHDIVALVRESIDANQAYARTFGARIAMAVAPAGARAMVDSDRFAQVMANLLSNASKFSPRDATVDVSITHADGRIRVAVADQGPGIPDEFHDKLFEKFTQADASDNRVAAGTGLGLSIAKAIIERHGGTIAFVSVAGAGTTFSFDMPDQQEMEGLPDAVIDSSPCEGDRILVCEDDPDVASILKDMLTEDGRVCDIAYSAEQAKALLAERDYVALILDLILPGEDGVSLMGELRQDPRTRDLPIIVVSVKAGEAEGEVANGDAISVVDWLTKPVDRERLRRAIGQCDAASESQGRILCVEGDPDAGSVTGSLPVRIGDVVHADTLEEAHEALAGEAFDLVVIDLSRMDGDRKDILGSISRAADKPVPVLILSEEENITETANGIVEALNRTRTSSGKLRETIQRLITQGKTGGAKTAGEKT